MNALSDFDITKKWPAVNPKAIQLYSLPTPNGVKISAMLEETGLEYEPHKVNFSSQDQHTPEFLSLNPNNKIPAIIDPNGPNGTPVGIWESGAILLYLAEKSGQFLSDDQEVRIRTIQWMMFQIGGLGPMLGQFGYFHKFAGTEIEDKRPLHRYRDEGRRLLKVLNDQLSTSEYVASADYSIADIALWPWVRAATGFYEASEPLQTGKLAHLNRWYEACANRPASLRAINIPA